MQSSMLSRALCARLTSPAFSHRPGLVGTKAVGRVIPHPPLSLRPRAPSRLLCQQPGRSSSSSKAGNSSLTGNKRSAGSYGSGTSDGHGSAAGAQQAKTGSRANATVDPYSLGAAMLAVALGTLGLSYAAVPLYRIFCQSTGFGGTTKRHTGGGEDEGYDLPADPASLPGNRPLRVTFNTDVSQNLPWSFKPVQKHVTVRGHRSPCYRTHTCAVVQCILCCTRMRSTLALRCAQVLAGQTALAFFEATNHSDEPIIGVATCVIRCPMRDPKRPVPAQRPRPGVPA